MAEEKQDIKGLVKYNVTDAALAEMKEQFGGLTIAGTDDKEGYQKVVEARNTVRKTRLEVEAKRKDLKKDSLEFGRLVDSEAKRITAELSPLEEALEAQKKAIDDEIERQKFLAVQKEKLPERIKELEELDQEVTPAKQLKLLEMSDAEFTDLVQGIKAMKLKEEREAQEKEAARIKEEQEAEAKRLEDERRKLEEEKEAENQRIAAAQKKLDDEKAALEAEKEAEAARKKKEEEDRIAAEAREKELQKAKEEAAEKARQEEIARQEAEVEAEKKRKEKEAADKKAADEKLAQQKKYRDFLEKNGYTQEKAAEFKIENVGGTITLFKKIDEIKL